MTQLPSTLPTFADALDRAARQLAGESVAWHELATMHACAVGYARAGELVRAAETMRLIAAELAKLTSRANDFAAAHAEMLAKVAAAATQTETPAAPQVHPLTGSPFSI